ncbi:XRE family transcriptional regulator [Actinoplanes sp. NPDC049668]|uniref:helix-turn-helix domain-containing protein n=1 Tax=unclassified Actinoplanes TaxID=2626549 RepID=UPI00339DB490
MAVSSETLISRIRSAMNSAGLSQQSLAQAIGIDPSALSKALGGVRNFKSLEVALIAERLGVSVQSLLSDSAEPTVAVAARAQPDTSPALMSALDRSRFLLELERLLADLGFGWSASLCDSSGLDGQAYAQGAELSRRTRAWMGIGDDDLPYELTELSDLLEQKLGIDIGFEPLPTGLDGLCATCGGFRLALVSSNIAATRQRFTLAHELGHLVAGDSQDLLVDEDVFGRRTPEETRANAFAAAFLMPEAAIRAAVPHGGASEEIVAQLLGRFGVSLDALAFRLHNVGVVNAAGRDRVRSMSSNRIALRSGRASDLQARGDRRAPGNLLDRAMEAYFQGRISVRPLAELLAIDPELLLAELRPPTEVTADETADSMEYNL